MKNTTLGRSKKTGLEKNSGTSHEPRRNDQAGDGRDFAFNGQMGDGVNRAGNRYAGNQFSTAMKENYGMKEFARRGNHSDQSVDRMERVGPSATKDGLKQTIATAAEGHNVGKEHTARGFKNPDAINLGMK